MLETTMPKHAYFQKCISIYDYFINEHLLQQVKNTIDIFKCIHPEATALFLWDQAPYHPKVADDALNVGKMNVGPGGKQPIMCNMVTNGRIQQLVNSNGKYKGMKKILEERGINTS